MHISLILAFAAVLCAALLSFTLTPLVRVLAFKIGAVDIPKDNRRMHKVPIPRIGGLAIFVAFALTILAFCNTNKFLIPALFGGLVLIVLGVLDDIYNLNAFIKLGVQIAVSLFAVYEGVEIKFFSCGAQTILLGGWSIPLTVIWIVALINSVNLIDGLDGLACGVSIICASSLFVVMLVLGDFNMALITAILIGACFGFMPYNAHPAKIFMGDTGSQALGYILAILSVQGVFKTHMVLSFIIPISIFGLPLFDTLFAVLRRLIHRKSLFSADRGHIHHRLIDMGFGQKKSVRILYSICGILGISAVLLTLGNYVPAGLIIISGLALFVSSAFVFKNPATRHLTGMFDEIDAKETGIAIATQDDISNQVENLANPSKNN